MPITLFQLHGSIVAFIPLLPITGLSRWTFLALVCYAAFLIYCRARRRTPVEMITFWRVKHVDRCQWPAF